MFNIFKFTFRVIYLGLYLSLSSAAASAQSTATQIEEDGSPLFLKDITSHPDIKKWYQELSSSGEINSHSFGQSSLVKDLEALGSDPNSARFFYFVCSGRVPYMGRKFTKEDFEALVEQKRLSQELQSQLPDRDRLKLTQLIVRASADSFFCGSKVQLSFPLEGALEETSHLSHQTCAEKLKPIQGEWNKYDAVFFKYMDHKKYENFDRKITTKDVIVEALTSSFLCEEN